MNHDITREQVDSLVQHSSWLQQEAEALRYVIRTIPYDEKMPDGYSIQQELIRHEYLQRAYYRPIVDQVHTSRSVRNPVPGIQEIIDSFDPGAEKPAEIEKTLSRIAKQRAAIVTVLEKLPLIDWEQMIELESGTRQSIFDLVEQMIVRDREVLKSIADMVLVFQKENQARRELKSIHPEKGENSPQRTNESSMNGLE